MGPPVTAIALIGLGEVGRVLAEDLGALDGVSLSCWDIAFADPASRASTNAVGVGLDRAPDAPAAVAASDLVISAVTAGSTLEAALSVAAAIAPGTWYLDLNSASPVQKQGAAAVIEQAGGRYVEAAVMSPIEPKRIAAPMLLGGPHAEDFARLAGPLGLSGLEVYSDMVGPAAATKLCRSVVIKGLEALLTEAMVAARAWGVEDRVLGSLSNLVPVPDWPELAAYMVSRSLEHGSRRAEEMREAARMVAETGIHPLMASATAERQAWAADFGAAASAGELTSMIDAMRERLSPVGADEGQNK
jgi:3-hydroxyisobutyrate dehydrogenase-like beta-hydroxyacid dehydrogenase